MNQYEPGVFAQLYESQLGQEIWALLNKKETIASLETASRLGKPAVEGIEEQLLEGFGAEVLADRVKQMIGHMVRQILEHRGWILDQSEVRVSSVPFIKATRYRQPDWHTLHAYRNSGNPRDVAITAIRRTNHLPSNVRWTYYLTFESPLKAATAFDLKDFKEVKKQVQEKGYVRITVRHFRSQRKWLR
jgi:hypothetical protein